MSARPILHPAKPRKPRYKACGSPECSETFEVKRLGQKTCANAKCALAFIRAEKKAEALREIRKERQVFRARTKTVSKLKAEAQREVNRYIRLRDRDLGCVSCHMPASYEGPWHAGHYRSRGAADHLRFHDDNLAKQCSQCNEHKSGNLVEYRKGLIARIGLERVEALENDNRVHRWGRDELVAIRHEAVAKRKAIEELERQAVRIVGVPWMG